jgi:predicted HicB family RNase H-like nuclease
MATMEYKGYIGHVEFDDDAGLFHGEVINTRDVITFQGASVAELRKALRGSINDYLAFCAARGEDPDKTFSGKFLVRIDARLHRDIVVAAAREQKSVNTFVADALADHVSATR